MTEYIVSVSYDGNEFYAVYGTKHLQAAINYAQTLAQDRGNQSVLVVKENQEGSKVIQQIK